MAGRTESSGAARRHRRPMTNPTLPHENRRSTSVVRSTCRSARPAPRSKN